MQGRLPIALLFCLISTIVYTSACTNSLTSMRAKVQQDLFQAENSHNFQRRILRTSTFSLFSLVRPAQHASDTLHVYIEGDGFAWATRTRPSSNPTPTASTTLDMARHDTTYNAVLYLARPCQYQQNDALCEQRFWTTDRFAPEVISASSEAIDQIKAQVGAKKVVLVGYSGGGAVAALVAAQRQDVTFLGSVAGTLNTKAFTDFHKVTPLHGSRNPQDIAMLVQSIPQRHVSSPSDAIIPPLISASFCKAQQRPEYCLEIPHMKHGDSWYKMWDYTYY